MEQKHGPGRIVICNLQSVPSSCILILPRTAQSAICNLLSPSPCRALAICNLQSPRADRGAAICNLTICNLQSDNLQTQSGKSTAICNLKSVTPGAICWAVCDAAICWFVPPLARSRFITDTKSRVEGCNSCTPGGHSLQSAICNLYSAICNRGC